jgi:gamma-glutamylcyclotransferase (GGCT)/AIG2-like uncharacterized protein YtfP
MSGEGKRVFVYGTLKRGGSNHHHLNGQKFLGEARTAPGFRLYDLGGFPGMIARRDDREGVFGEVWAVAADALARLDELEGLAEGVYTREPVPLLPPFSTPPVDAYFYAGSVTGRRDLGAVWTE